MQTPQFLLIEGCDFTAFPIGGQLTSAMNFMRAFGDKVGLVGYSRRGEPTGRWVRKRFGGAEYWFFGVAAHRSEAGRPLIPRRLSFFLSLRKHRDAILSLGCRRVLMQAPESLLAGRGWNWESICYRMAGTSNALDGCRYFIGRALARVFESQFIDRLRNVDTILASADSESIDRFVRRAGGRIEPERIVAFPTRVDTSHFRPMPRGESRAAIGVAETALLAVTVGRIARPKGWRFLLDSFQRFQAGHSHAMLIFVGDGEDRGCLEAEIGSRNLGDSAFVTGAVPRPKVAEYLNAADLVVIGSEGEGWSLAMTEALASGKPLVSTVVSGASAMVLNGQNGFILERRDPDEFARAMGAALFLDRAAEVSLALAQNYSVSTLARDLCAAWPALAASYAHVQVADQVADSPTPLTDMAGADFQVGSD